jgi:DNA-binding GntR family transcriptional regulator
MRRIRNLNTQGPDDTDLLSVATLSGSMATSAEQLVGNLADRISAKIVAGEYPPGSRLRQEALAEEFSVSRTPIREVAAA